MSDAPSRARLSPVERNFRSRIAQLASGNWILRGSLSERASKCGKPACICASGEFQLANALTKLATAQFSVHDLRIDDLPLYYQYDDERPTEQVKQVGFHWGGLALGLLQVSRS